MARNETVLRILVSHPADTNEEAKIIEDVANAFNATWSAHLGIRLEYSDWHSHVAPGIDSDPQMVINKQIGSAYDIFIGVLWKHFGTATPRATSGTAEEFEAAYARHKVSPASIRVMVYFRMARVELNEIDTKQLDALRDFKSKLGPRGVLYSEYFERDEFETLVRDHLQRMVQEWGKSWGIGVSADPPPPPVLSGVSDNNDEGYLDLFVTVVQDMASSTEAIVRIGLLMSTSTEATELGTRDLSLVNSLPPDEQAAAVKDIFDAVGRSLVNFSEGLEREAKSFSDSFNSAMEALSKLYGYEEFTDSMPAAKRAESDEAIVSVRTKIQENVGVMQGFRTALMGLPRATTAFNRARKRANAAVEEYERVLNAADNLVAQLKAK